MGQAGSVITFVFLYALFCITAIFVISYASRCFLVVFEGTATGNDEVQWSDETYLDWVWRGATVVWLILVWLAPAGMVLKVVAPNVYKDNPLIALLVGGLTLWLLFPLGVLSSLSGSTRWVFFRWRILTGMFKIASTVLGFYATSLVVIVGPLLLWYFALTASGWLIILAGLIGSAALFIYARLLGRVAWALVGLNPRRKKKRKFKDECSALPPLLPPSRVTAPAPVQASEEDAEVYGFGEVEPPPRRDAVQEPQRRPREQDGYELAEVEEEEKGGFDAEQMMQPIQRKVLRAQVTIHKTEPPRSLVQGVWSFPFYETSQTSWVRLSLCGMFAGAVLRLIISTAPG